MVAILAMGYLSARQIINWDDIKGVSWGIAFIIGAGLTLGGALTRAESLHEELTAISEVPMIEVAGSA